MEGGGVHQAQLRCEVLGAGGGKVLLILIAQGAEQEDGISPGRAGVPGAKGRFAGAVGQALVRQPRHIGRGGLVDVGKGAGDAAGAIGVLSALLRSVKPDQHNGGLATGGDRVQGKAVGPALEHADGGQLLRRIVKAGGGGGDTQQSRQCQSGEQDG